MALLSPEPASTNIEYIPFLYKSENSWLKFLNSITSTLGGALLQVLETKITGVESFLNTLYSKFNFEVLSIIILIAILKV